MEEEGREGGRETKGRGGKIRVEEGREVEEERREGRKERGECG